MLARWKLKRQTQKVQERWRRRERVCSHRTKPYQNDIHHIKGPLVPAATKTNSEKTDSDVRRDRQKHFTVFLFTGQWTGRRQTGASERHAGEIIYWI